MTNNHSNNLPFLSKMQFNPIFLKQNPKIKKFHKIQKMLLFYLIFHLVISFYKTLVVK